MCAITFDSKVTVCHSSLLHSALPDAVQRLHCMAQSPKLRCQSMDHTFRKLKEMLICKQQTWRLLIVSPDLCFRCDKRLFFRPKCLSGNDWEPSLFHLAFKNKQLQNIVLTPDYKVHGNYRWGRYFTLDQTQKAGGQHPSCEVLTSVTQNYFCLRNIFKSNMTSGSWFYSTFGLSPLSRHVFER